MQQYQGVNGEVLPDTNTPGWLRIEHVLQRFRDVWVPIDTYPFLAADTERVQTHCDATSEFPVFANGRMMQNLRLTRAVAVCSRR